MSKRFCLSMDHLLIAKTVLRESHDPEFALGSFEQGGRVALCAKKRKWRLLGLADPAAGLEEPASSEARQRYPNLVVGPLGAIKKDGHPGVVTARVLFDGTNGIEVNKKTRLRDQERAPVASDLKRVMRRKPNTTRTHSR